MSYSINKVGHGTAIPTYPNAIEEHQHMNIYTEHEAFTYIWYNANERMFYLGYHKGSPTDGYSHSSKLIESFDANNPPKGWKRKILAYGTQNEMRELEYNLLQNRKKKWNRYYNQAAGWSFPINEDMRSKISIANSKRVWKQESRNKLSDTISGENHPLYGKKHSEEAKEKMSEAHSGKILSEEHKKKIGKSLTGKKRKLTEQAKANIAAANRRRAWCKHG